MLSNHQPSTTAAEIDVEIDLENVEGDGKKRKVPVVIHVNERRVKVPDDDTTGLQIKRRAIKQGVPIQEDFILVEELGGDRTRVIGDHDHVHVTKKSRFLANDGDDNS